MSDQTIVRVEIEYDDGEIRRATDENAAQIWKFYKKAAEFYLRAQKRSYEGPIMQVVREAEVRHEGDTQDDMRVRRTLSELARAELSPDHK